MSDASTTPSGRSGGVDVMRYMPKRSFGLKLLLVCLLALLMAIPAMFVWGLVYERSQSADHAIESVSQARGGRQVMLGPVLVAPYRQTVIESTPTGPNGAMVENRRLRHGRFVVYAETGEAQADLTTELLKRGIHRAPVFDVSMAMKAAFDLESALKDVPQDAEILWDDAEIYMGLADLRGARDSAVVTLNGRSYDLAPANTQGGDWQNGYNNAAPSALVGWGLNLISTGPLGVDPAAMGKFDVDASIRFTGAQRLAFTAFAKDTSVKISGDWASPSFEGGFLPVDREVTDAGFTAEWRIPFLARGAPGAGPNLSFDQLVNADLGVLLLDEASPYQSVTRALKYAPMFVGLVFLAYFLFEATSGMRAHPAQYVLVGLAQAVFYLLLLGVSEHAGFTAGFLLAAVATVLTLSLYAGAVFRSRMAIARALGVFTTLYALIFVLMRMEDYALLVGSVASFMAIAFTMWMTRDLDWYGLSASTEDEAASAQ